MFTSDNTGNQLPTAKDTTTPSTANSAPNSTGSNNSIQYWMYIKDWNTNYGKEKHVLSRSDPSNPAIMNPKVSLHPTDNTLQISISIFPDTQGGSKSEPAPAGHSGSTDDVFVCDVPNIPLQEWMSVSISMETRNLDAYINGKLVKSCLLSGVPKPVAGQIELNKDGGFSGHMCGLRHYSRMLVPSDAQSFYSAGTPCSLPSGTKNGTVTFGIFDTKGKELNKYVF